MGLSLLLFRNKKTVVIRMKIVLWYRQRYQYYGRRLMDAGQVYGMGRKTKRCLKSTHMVINTSIRLYSSVIHR